MNIIVSSLASKFVNQQLRFDRKRYFCHCQVSARRRSFIIFAKGFMTGIGVESGGISYDVYLNKTFSVYFRLQNTKAYRMLVKNSCTDHTP